MSNMSPGFHILMNERPQVMQAWLGADRIISQHSALDPKINELIYIAVLGALGLHRGIAFHAAEAKKLGATRDEVISAILAALPAGGNRVIEALEYGVSPFDGE